MATTYTHGVVFIGGARASDDTLDAIIRDNEFGDEDAAALRSGATLVGGGGASLEWRIVPYEGDPALEDS